MKNLKSLILILNVSGVCRIEGGDWSPEESERGHEWGTTVGKSGGNHSPEGKTGGQGERDGGNDKVWCRC